MNICNKKNALNDDGDGGAIIKYDIIKHNKFKTNSKKKNKK